MNKGNPVLDPHEQAGGIGRREFLKRASVGGAALAILYVAPTFTSAGARPAYASVTAPSTGSETAFAYGGLVATCFTDLGFGNWGWSNGPLGEGTYTFDLYAGAGQCDLSKGTQVGTVRVVYDAGSVEVTYNLTSPHTMTEAHVYAGNTATPVGPSGPTVAPGQYTAKDDSLANVTTHAVTINGLSGDIYVVAHAVVHGT